MKYYSIQVYLTVFPYEDIFSIKKNTALNKFRIRWLFRIEIFYGSYLNSCYLNVYLMSVIDFNNFVLFKYISKYFIKLDNKYFSSLNTLKLAVKIAFLVGGGG